MRKNLNKLATLALSGMMVMSMAVPSFAAVKTTEYSKVLHTDGNTYAPNTSFTFKVVEKTGKVTFEGKEYDAATPKETGAVTTTAAVFAPKAGDLGVKDAEGASFTSKFNINVDEDKIGDKPGYYFYTLSENPAGYEGVRYSTITYTIMVIRHLDSNGQLTSTTVVQRDGNKYYPASKPAKIQNNYGKHFPPETPDFPDPKPDPSKPKPDPNPDNDTTHDVVIKKRVAGNMPNTSKMFNFEVTVYSQDNAGEFFKVTEVNGQGAQDVESNESYFVDGQPKQFSFNDKNGIHIFGLTKGDRIHVKETNGEEYEMTVGAVTDKASYFDMADLVAGKKYEGNFMVKKDGAKAEIVNSRNAVTPTGIVMNVAPYAMMLAVAGGLGVVFMNRKKEEE